MNGQLQNIPMQGTLLVRGARQLLTLRGSAGPRRGAALGDLGIVRDGAVLIREGKILEAGPSRRLENVAAARNAREINAAGRLIVPGFVDCLARLWIPESGSSEAAGAGNDVEFRHGVKELSALPAPRLEARARNVLNGLVRHGTTSVSVITNPAPARSGELKMMRVLASLHGKPVDVITAYGGAEFVPPEFEGDEEAYVESLCTEFMPVISRRKLARFAVLNCRAFRPAAARRYLDCARSLGFRLTVWAAKSAYAAPLAVEMEAASVMLDDLAYGKIGGLAKSPSIVLVVPGSVFRGRLERRASIRTLIDSGAAIALASGFGLEDGPTYNMQMVISLACSEMGMSPAEAISAATINAAHALGCEARCGSLEPAKRADLLLLNVEDYRDLVYRFGINHVHMVLKNGTVVYQEGEVTHWSGK